MATVQMTKKLGKELTTDIKRLLGRGRKAFPCPLSREDQAVFWCNMQPPEHMTAYHLLRKAGYDTSSMTTWYIEYHTKLDGDPQRYEIRFVGPTDREAVDRLVEPPTKEPFYYERDMKAAFPHPERFAAYCEWIKNTAIVERDFLHALVSFEAILKFCGTVGQLVRAVPDLYMYLPEDRQNLVRSQTRSSNMPHEWATFDRSRVTNLEMALAKAQLMPPQRSEWNEIFLSTGRFVNK